MSEDNKLLTGQIVKSKAGHDRGNIFFVVGIIDDNYVLIADGDRRRIEAPKKKKVRHLQPYNKINDSIAEKLAQGVKIDNIELQKELERSGAIELAVSDSGGDES